MDANYLLQMLEQAATFEKNGQLDLALNIYNVALQLLPASETKALAQVYQLRGGISYRLKNHAGAMDDLRRAIELNPELANSLSGDFSQYYKEGSRCKH